MNQLSDGDHFRLQVMNTRNYIQLSHTAMVVVNSLRVLNPNPNSTP